MGRGRWIEVLKYGDDNMLLCSMLRKSGERQRSRSVGRESGELIRLAHPLFLLSPSLLLALALEGMMHFGTSESGIAQLSAAVVAGAF